MTLGLMPTQHVLHVRPCLVPLSQPRLLTSGASRRSGFLRTPRTPAARASGDNNGVSGEQPPASQQPHAASTVAAAASSSSSKGSGPKGFGQAPRAKPKAGKPGKPTLKQQAAASNQEVYDKLIEVFRAKTPEEWRKLIAFSKQWPSLAQGVLDRIAELAAAAPDLDEQLSLRKFRKKLESVHSELGDYKALVETFRDAPSREWESMVVQHRNVLASPFFDYLELRVRAAHENKGEQDALIPLAAQLAALVEAHDRVLRDTEALEAAQQNFGALLEVDNLEQAEQKIDELAASGKLDPALLLTMAKAYAGVKETDITQEEVKDLMAHLYFKAKESFAQQAPPEVRILKFLLTVDSPSDRYKLMGQAFEAGPQLVTGDADYLSTTPQQLLNTVSNVLAIYESSRGASTMAGQAAGLMSPEVISRLRDLEAVIRKDYL